MWFLVGPTAVGKTEIALELALLLDAEIVSADSMQVYRGMDVGTAKPSMEERRGIPHHLIDVVGPDEMFDVARFRSEVMRVLPEIENRGKRALIVGGSGMYVRALTQGLFQGVTTDAGVRAKWDRFAEERGVAELRAAVSKADPAAARRIGQNDRRRLVRAMEHFELTGRPLSEAQTQWKSSGGESNAAHVLVGLSRPREELYARCDARVLQMVKRGLIEEARALRPFLERHSTASQAVGYKEALAFLRGEWDEKKMIEQIQRGTRQLAKRQLTWFRREPNLNWIEINGGQEPRRVASFLRALYCP